MNEQREPEENETPTADAIARSWSPDGGRLAAGDSNGVVRVYDIADGDGDGDAGAQTLTLRQDGGVIALTGWTTNGTQLISGEGGGRVRSWWMDWPATQRWVRATAPPLAEPERQAVFGDFRFSGSS